MIPRYIALALLLFSSLVMSQEKPELRIPVWPSGTKEIKFSSDGELFLAYGNDPLALLCDVKTGKILQNYTFSAKGYNFGCFIGPEDKVLLFESFGSVEVFKPGSIVPEVSIRLESTFSIDRLSISADGSMLVSFDDSVIVVHDLTSGRMISRIPAYSNENQPVRGAWFGKDDKTVLVATMDNKLLTFDSRSGKQLKSTKLAPTGEVESEGEIFLTKITPASENEVIVQINESLGTLTAWKASTGYVLWQKKFLKRQWEDSEPVFNSDRDWVAFSSSDSVIDIVEVNTGRLISKISTTRQSRPIEFSLDSKYISIFLGGFAADTLVKPETSLWSTTTAKRFPFQRDSATGMPLFTRFNPVNNELIELTILGLNYLSITGDLKYFVPRNSFPGNAVVSDGMLFSVSEGFIKRRDMFSGRIESMLSLPGQSLRIPRTEIVFQSLHSHLQKSDDDSMILSNSLNEIVALNHNLMKTGEVREVPQLLKWMLRFYDGFEKEGLTVNEDAKYIAVYDADTAVSFYNLSTSSQIGQFLHEEATRKAFFGPAEDEITVFLQYKLRPEEYKENVQKLRIAGEEIVKSGEPVGEFNGWMADVSKGAKYTLLGGFDKYQVIENTRFAVIMTVTGVPYKSIRFDKTGNYLVIVSYSGFLSVFDLLSGKKVSEFNLGQNEEFTRSSEFEFFPSTGYLSCFDAHEGKYWLIDTRKMQLESKVSFTGGFIFASPDQDLLISGDKDCYTFHRVSTGKELFKLYEFGDVWAVRHSSGLFDATPGAMEKMYYVQGVNIIEFDQLKDKYWEPGLYEKVMKGERLRDVESINSKLDLWPEVKELLFRENYEKLEISLENQGGGIGKVQVFLNGKEIINDARGKEVKPTQKSASVMVDLKNHPFLINGENKVEVVTWNESGTLSGKREAAEFLVEKEIHQPAIYIVAIGVSDYEGNKIDLKYAAKDAGDFLSAAKMAANNLFTGERTHTYLLNTAAGNPLQPTKAEITKTFKEIAKNAGSEDVLIVYLSGHGLNLGGESGDLHYLTRDAFSPNPEIYNDPAIKNKCTISGVEMIELLKEIPATKQVLIIDACSSGKLVDNLVEKRDIESSIVKALDRMKDRAGLHIITGSAADAVSYEASKYGQGLLTYSLLAGMKGLALKDNKTVDVALLMQHAREMVPKLAEGIGGIQEPKIFSPKGAESFDIGLILEQDKQLIPLAKEKDIFVNSIFQDVNEFSDIVSLGELINQKLEDISRTEKGNRIVFWGINSFPGAYRISGSYSLDGNKIEVRYKIIKDKEGSQTITLIGNKNALSELADKIIKSALEEI